MLVLVTASLLWSVPELPEACRPPALRDVAPLTELAQRSGALSVGLDSVATWCFDPSGTWTAGVTPSAGDDEPVAPTRAPTGDCLKALEVCRVAKEGLSPSLTELLDRALADLDRPFLGTHYTPKRSGLLERPAPAADCSLRAKGALHAQAQARMDWARLASQTQSEYGNYRTWLYAQGLRCAEAVAAAEVDPTRRGLGVDRAASGDGGVMILPPAASSRRADRSAAPPGGPGVAPPSEGAPPPPPEADRVPDLLSPSIGALEASSGRASPPSMLASWQALAAERTRMESDPDWVAGFLASRELRDCRCAPPVPSDIVRRIERGVRVEELEGADEQNVRCERCVQASFAPWRSRVTRQCQLMARLTDYELGVLERSDDGNGLPPRCFAAARAVRGLADAGTTLATSSTGATFIITQRTEAGRPPGEPAPPLVPQPPREPGRSYLKLFMSSTCVAEIDPGPVQLRTGDLLPIPLGASLLRVHSPCGGIAEVYWGQEEKPRVSETFGRNQPLELRFAR